MLLMVQRSGEILKDRKQMRLHGLRKPQPQAYIEGSAQSRRGIGYPKLSTHLHREQEGHWACQGGGRSRELYLHELDKLSPFIPVCRGKAAAFTPRLEY